MEMDDGQAGYYNDLLNRVDTTITQNRSAYGGREHSGDDESSSSTNWFGGENRRIHFHVSFYLSLSPQRAVADVRSLGPRRIVTGRNTRLASESLHCFVVRRLSRNESRRSRVGCSMDFDNHNGSHRDNWCAAGGRAR